MHSLLLTSLALSLGLWHTALAASPADWRNRSIYQILTDRFALTNGSTTTPCDTAQQIYCGGTFQGVINHLDYIQGMGFDAIWISPITQQLVGDTQDGEAYHGYWQQDLYNVNPNFGTASDLQSLASELHSRGMWLMVDVVFNHFAYDGSPSSINYSIFNPFNTQSDFHSYCAIDYSDISDTEQLTHCWEGDQIVPLADVVTESPSIRSTYQSWINGLISDYSVDGFRVDSVLEMETGFWSPMQNATNGIYMVGEVDNSNATLVCSYEDYISGVLNYGIYQPLISAFQSTSGSMSYLASEIGTVASSCVDTSLLGTFSENQDQPRFAQLNPDMAAAQNVIVFTMLTDGIPIIYEGQEQHYESYGGSGVPYNREAIWLSGYDTSAPLYTLVATLNAARSNAISVDPSYTTTQNSVIYTDTTTIAMRKAAFLNVLSNKGSDGASYTQVIPAGYPAGTQLTELLTCDTLSADSSGDVTVPMGEGQARVYYPTANLSGSGLCGSSSKRGVRWEA